MDKSAYEVIQIDDKSWRIEENGVRSFLFVGTEFALLIDSGFGSGDLKSEIDMLTDLPVMLINTHADRDHIGCNSLFDQDKVFMHPSDFDRYHKMMGKEFIVKPVWEGDIIDIGGRCFEITLFPGHTPGSIALLDIENGILIAGDTVQAGAIFMFGTGRDINAYIYSLKEISNMRESFDKIYPSHGAFPLDTDIIDALISGAEQIRDGKIEGTDPPHNLPAKLYSVGSVKFLY